jgi:hypothetical protein
MSQLQRLSVACTAFLVTACSGVYSAPPPRVPVATVIELCMGAGYCDQGRFQIADPSAVESVLRAYRRLDDGWVTAENLAVTRGWFTTPTFRNYAVLLDATGRELQVLYFDTGLVCSRQIAPSGTGSPDVYHKSPDALLEALQTAPRVPIGQPSPVVSVSP